MATFAEVQTYLATMHALLVRVARQTEDRHQPERQRGADTNKSITYELAEAIRAFVGEVPPKGEV